MGSSGVTGAAVHAGFVRRGVGVVGEGDGLHGLMWACAVGVPVGERNPSHQGDKQPPHDCRGNVWGLKVTADF